MKKPLIFIFCLFSVFAFYGCPKDDNPVKPDPCSITPIKTKIVFYERINYRYFEADTTFTQYFIHVSAEGDSATEWHWDIENGTYQKSEKSFSGNFTNNGTYHFSLIAKRVPNQVCFPEDDGWDTVKKNLVILGDQYKSKICGDYKGFFADSPKDTFVISLFWQKPSPTEYPRMRISNMSKGCVDTVDGYPLYYSSVGYKNGWFLTNGNPKYNCEPAEGWMRVNTATDEITIDYELTDKKIKKVFVGRRI